MIQFTAHDRCDKCHSQAYCRARKGGLDMLFCSHHAREFGPDLLAQGFLLETQDVPQHEHVTQPTS